MDEQEGEPRSQVGSQVSREKLARQALPNRGRIYDKAGILVSDVLLYKLRRERNPLLHTQQLTLTAQTFRKTNKLGVRCVQFA
jgi:hypothetical protein